MYDPLNRLIQFAETGGSQAAEWTQNFGYDPFGNRSYLSSSIPIYPQYSGVTPQATAPAAPGQTVSGPFANNRWTQAMYDSAGNMTTKSTVQVGPIATYDGEGRVQTITGLTAMGVSEGTIRYYYDGNGNRVMKVICSGSLCTSATAGAQITTYVYDALGQLAAEYGPPASVTGTQYLFQDHLGTTRLMVSSTGQVTQCYDFAPFGDELGPTVGPRSGCYEALMYPSASQASTALKFTGQERDTETGVDYFGARYMSPWQGRFTSPDLPFLNWNFTDPQSLNLYSYGRNNPLQNVDPTGRTCVTVTHGDGTSNLADDGDGKGCVGAGVNPSTNQGSGTTNSKDDQKDIAPQEFSFDGTTNILSLVPTPVGNAGQNAKRIGSCFVKGAAAGAGGALVVGGLALGAMTLGPEAAAVVTGTLFVAGVAGGLQTGFSIGTSIANRNFSAAAYGLGSLFGSAAVAGAIGGTVGRAIDPDATPGWSPMRDWMNRYRPSLGKLPQWLATGPDVGAARGSTALAGSGLGGLLGGCN